MSPSSSAPRLSPETLRQQLARIDGFDPEVGMRNLNGEHLMLLRVLRRFATTCRDGVPVLLDATGTEHEVIERWRYVCHSLRGALQTIGARALSAQTVELEQELRTFGSRASFVAKARQLHESVIDFSRRLTLELAAIAPDACERR